MAVRTQARLSDGQLVELLGLLSGADSAELKLTIPDAAQLATVRALGIDPLDAQIRQVFFFDTPNLDLHQAGVVVRARRVQGKGNDSVVKLRPVVPDHLPDSIRESPSVVVEVDAGPDSFVCSASMKNSLPGDAVEAAVSGKKKLHHLFSREQRDFFAAHAPDTLELDDLSVLGPIFVLKVRFVPDDIDRRLVAELWLYPDGTRILELSTKCAPTEAFQVAAEVRGFLATRNIDLGGEQQTKTATALGFFSQELSAPTVPAPRQG